MQSQEFPEVLSGHSKVTKGIHKYGSELLSIFIFPLFAIGLNPAEWWCKILIPTFRSWIWLLGSIVSVSFHILGSEFSTETKSTGESTISYFEGYLPVLQESNKAFEPYPPNNLDIPMHMKSPTEINRADKITGINVVGLGLWVLYIVSFPKDEMK